MSAPDRSDPAKMLAAATASCIRFERSVKSRRRGTSDHPHVSQHRRQQKFRYQSRHQSRLAVPLKHRFEFRNGSGGGTRTHNLAVKSFTGCLPSDPPSSLDVPSEPEAMCLHPRCSRLSLLVPGICDQTVTNRWANRIEAMYAKAISSSGRCHEPALVILYALDKVSLARALWQRSPVDPRRNRSAASACE